MKCKGCSCEAQEEDNFCRGCGEEFDVYECECGAEINEGDKFCHECGAELSMEDDDEDEDNTEEETI